MSFFSKKKTKERYTIFLVEDNALYAKQLEYFLKSKYETKADILYFPVSEVLDLKFAANVIPDVIIMDHFLNEKYDDASLGFNALKEIKKQYPEIELILHTAQESVDLAVAAIREGVCHYVAKNKDGFARIEAIINKTIH